MRLTWVSGDDAPQQVQYGDGMSQTSVVTTFTQADMCSEFLRPMTVYVLCFPRQEKQATLHWSILIFTCTSLHDSPSSA